MIGAGALPAGTNGLSDSVTIGYNKAPVPLHSTAIVHFAKQPKEGVMRDGMGRQAARFALAIGLLVTLAGCVVYPAGPGYWHPHPCCYYWR
jgi:hypothetical protein